MVKTYNMTSSRRQFVLQSLMAAVAIPYSNKGAAQQVKMDSAFPIGIAGYTFYRIDIQTTIRMMQRLGIQYLSLKDIHLPLNSSDEVIKSTMAQFSAAGIQVYAVGVIYMKNKEAVDQAFRYAVQVGVTMIVGVPDYELLDYCEQKVKQTNIRLAIHNHGPKDPLYPGPGDAYTRIKNRDQRIGLCIDIGHTIRAGVLPQKAVLNYGDRLMDLHIKDVTLAANEGVAIEMGRGVINFPALVRAMKKVSYTGICSIEYEKDMQDPLPGIAESLGYFRAMLAEK
jgi:sugar phosphate isomerase/epimerase